jgi:hypothetical protein
MGYVCLAGSDTATPTNGINGYICPAGSYCPEGSTIETFCPAGTFSNSTGLQAESDCTPCTAGYYCSSTGNNV